SNREIVVCYFFFQAEDGIRDFHVTGVQTCALPILPLHKSLYVATGFRKWGLTNGTAAAMMVIDQITGRSNPWQKVFDTTRIGDTKAIVEAAGHNLKSGAELTGGHLMRALRSPEPELRP